MNRETAAKSFGSRKGIVTISSIGAEQPMKILISSKRLPLMKSKELQITRKTFFSGKRTRR
ncbi:MAG: hypothetical protein LUD57_04725 [Ruminococcus sp.]|nr:hypothetical protein [Ruminococcus sp.]